MDENWFSLLNRFFFGSDIETSDDSTSQDLYVNQEAFVIETIFPGRRGQVSCGGTYWLARCPHPLTLEPSTVVRVTGRDNITLLVEPIPQPLPAAAMEKQF